MDRSESLSSRVSGNPVVVRSRGVVRLHGDPPSLAILGPLPLADDPALSRNVLVGLSLATVLRMLLTLLNCRLSGGDESPHPSTRILPNRNCQLQPQLSTFRFRIPCVSLSLSYRHNSSLSPTHTLSPLPRISLSLTLPSSLPPVFILPTFTPS